jgi:hypothetical protein
MSDDPITHTGASVYLRGTLSLAGSIIQREYCENIIGRLGDIGNVVPIDFQKFPRPIVRMFVGCDSKGNPL